MQFKPALFKLSSQSLLTVSLAIFFLLNLKACLSPNPNSASIYQLPILPESDFSTEQDSALEAQTPLSVQPQDYQSRAFSSIQQDLAEGWPWPSRSEAGLSWGCRALARHRQHLY